ncbi:MAG: ABC transporter, partial [Pseudomonadota bacterium]
MTPARWRALLFAGLAVLVAAALGLSTIYRQRGLPARPASERPTLMLLTSLPIVFGEDFSLEQQESPALKALRERYRVVPISVTDPSELARGRLLLMAQPPAQTAENLVALDQWVRGGGRVVLLADPMLEWPSKRPLGDPLRPPP